MVGQGADCPSCGALVEIREASRAEIQLAVRRRRGEPIPGAVQVRPVDPKLLEELENPDSPPTLVEYIPEPRQRIKPARTFSQQKQTSREWASIFGLSVTSTRLFIGVVVGFAVGLVVWMAWAKLTDNPYTARINQAQVVEVFDAISNLKTIETSVEAQQTGAPAMIHTLGGEESVRLLRPSVDGDHLMLDVMVSQWLFYQFATVSEQGLTLDSDLITLRGGQAPAKALFLIEPLSAPFAMDLSQAVNQTGWNALPSGLIADEEQPTGLSSMTVQFRSEGAIGKATFRPRDRSDVSTPLYVRGQIAQTTPGGASLIRQYDGQTMSLHWDGQSSAWRVGSQFLEPRSARVAGDRRLMLVLPRPRRLGYDGLTLWIGDQEAARVDASLAREESEQ